MPETLALIKLAEPGDCYMPPIGLWSIKANTDAQVTIYDDHLDNPLQIYSGCFNQTAVGLSAQFSCQDSDLRSWAKELKYHHKDVKILAGGFHSSLQESIPYVDEIVHGPGEGRPFKDLALPVIPRTVLTRYWNHKAPHNHQSKTGRWVQIETSRGCGRYCNFCGSTDFWGPYQAHPLDKLKVQLEAYRKEGVREVFIEDDNVSLDVDRFVELIKLLRDLKLWWSCPNGISTASLFKAPVRRALAKSTCWRLSLPFETGSLHTAKLMNIGPKFIEWSYANDLVETLKSYKIKTAGFFVIGYPGERKSDIDLTLYYANSLSLDDRYIYIATPYPGTRLLKDCLTHGYLTPDYDPAQASYTNCVINTPYLKAGTVTSIRRKECRKPNRSLT